jgi:hypothetical protein
MTFGFKDDRFNRLLVDIIQANARVQATIMEIEDARDAHVQSQLLLSAADRMRQAADALDSLAIEVLPPPGGGKEMT